MPTSELPARSGVDLQGVSSLAGLFLGKNSTQTSSGNITTTESVPQAAIDATVKSILEGTQGLAAVSSGQNRAGLYNSTTRQFMVNDLMARAAAEGAKLQKTTTTNKNETVHNRQAPQISGNRALTVLGGLQAASKFADTSIGKKVTDALGLKLGKKAGAGASVKAVGNSAPTEGPTESDVQDAINRGSGFDSTNITPSTSAGNNINGLDIGGGNSGAGVDINGLLGADSDAAGFDFGGTSTTADGGAEFADIGGGNLDTNFDFAGDTGVGSDVIPTDGVDFEAMNDVDFASLFDFAEGGHVTAKGNANKLAKMGSKGKGYASGGAVDLTNLGLRVKENSPLTGRNSATSNTQSAPSGGGSGSGVSIPSIGTSGNSSRRGRSSENDTNLGNSSESEGTTSGPTGTASENAAAVAGAVAQGVSMMAGPTIGLATSLAMSMMGIEHSPMNPMTAVLNAVVNSIASNNATPTSLESSQNDAQDTSNAAMFDAAMNDGLAAASAANNGDASPGEGVGIGGTGASAGDGNAGEGGNGSGVGGGEGGSDGGAGSAKMGKYIQGPGNETSDSIHIRASAGEFVLNAEAVKAVGLDTLNWINDTFKPSSEQLEAGKKVAAQEE